MYPGKSVAKAASGRTATGAALPLGWIAGGTGAGLLIVAAMMADERLTLDLFAPGAWHVIVWLALTAGLALGFRRAGNRVERTIRDAAAWYTIFSLIGLMGAIGTYPIAAATHGSVDATLQRIDAALRFRWLAWYELTAVHPLIQIAGRAAYESVFVTPAVLLGWWAWRGERAPAHAFLANFWVAATLTLALFRFMPAAGPFALEWHGVIPYMPESGLWQPMLINALRHRQVHEVALGSLRGLVSAPSFHTAAAVLYILGAWPVRRLRWPLVGVNVAMLLSTPVEGTHYLADMLIGACVAGVSFTAVAALGARHARATRRALLPA